MKGPNFLDLLLLGVVSLCMLALWSSALLIPQMTDRASQRAWDKTTESWERTVTATPAFQALVARVEADERDWRERATPIPEVKKWRHGR